MAGNGWERKQEELEACVAQQLESVCTLHPL